MQGDTFDARRYVNVISMNCSKMFRLDQWLQYSFKTPI